MRELAREKAKAELSGMARLCTILLFLFTRRGGCIEGIVGAQKGAIVGYVSNTLTHLGMYAGNCTRFESINRASMSVVLRGSACGCRVAECRFGRVLADAMAWSQGADVGLVNSRVLKASLAAGNVTWQNVHSALPSQDLITVVENMTGHALRRVLNHSISGLAGALGINHKLQEGPYWALGKFLQVSSAMRFQWSFDGAGEATVGDIAILSPDFVSHLGVSGYSNDHHDKIFPMDSDYRLLRDEDLLRVAVPRHLFSGGDGFSAFAQFPSSSNGMTPAEAMLSYANAVTEATASRPYGHAGASASKGDVGGPTGPIASLLGAPNRSGIMHADWTIRQTPLSRISYAERMALVAQAKLMQGGGGNGDGNGEGGVVLHLPWDWVREGNDVTYDPCEWAGVHCEHQGGRTVVLDLVLGHAISITPKLGSLTSLRRLSITNNSELSAIPEELGDLASLVELQISDNPVLSGTIPTTLGKLTSHLMNLIVHGNPRLSGTVPRELDYCRALNDVQFHLNPRISGTLPTSFTSLTNLKYLYFHSMERVSGVYPRAFGRLTGLRDMEVHTMPLLSGTYPRTLGKLSSLLYMYAWETPRISGTIPHELGGLTNLKEFSLHGTVARPLRLSGTLPSSLNSWVNLQYFQMSDAPFISGPIPSTMGTAPSLKEFLLTKMPRMRARVGSTSLIPLGAAVSRDFNYAPGERRHCALLESVDRQADVKWAIDASYGHYSWCTCAPGFARLGGQNIHVPNPTSNTSKLLCECVKCPEDTYMDLLPSKRFGLGTTRVHGNDACRSCPANSQYKDLGADAMTACKCAPRYRREEGL